MSLKGSQDANRFAQLVREFIDIFEKLVEMLRQLGKQLGMFETYARLYPTSYRLKQGLVEAYSAFLNFCLETRNIFNENRTKKSLCRSDEVCGLWDFEAGRPRFTFVPHSLDLKTNESFRD